jgi:anti-sigma factor RsiW
MGMTAFFRHDEHAVTCSMKSSLGAYVLGALDERERKRVDAHVAECSRCREELETLIPVRAYLARATGSCTYP